MKSLYALAAVTLLVGCQSTQTSAPLRTVNYSSPETIIKWSENKFLEKGAKATAEDKHDISILYAASYDPDIRKKAVPLLKELVESGHPGASFTLIGQEYMGAFGYVSTATYEKYKDQLNEENRKTIENSLSKDSEQFQHFLNHFNHYNATYANHQQTCAQPLMQQPTSIEKSMEGFMHWKYLQSCLAKYAPSNSATRLAALADLEQLLCKREPDKVCLADGFNALAQSQVDAETEEAVAYALRDIFQTHERYLRPLKGSPKGTPSSKGYAYMGPVLDAMKNEELESAITQMKSIIADPAIRGYDRAFYNRYLGLTYTRRDAEGDKTLAIRYFKTALDSKYLGLVEHYQTLETMFDVLMLNGQYKEAISQISSFIIKNQKDFDLIPVATMTAINAYVNPQKQTTAAPAI